MNEPISLRILETRARQAVEADTRALATWMHYDLVPAPLFDGWELVDTFDCEIACNGNLSTIIAFLRAEYGRGMLAEAA